jgi:hypothetical protein
LGATPVVRSLIDVSLREQRGVASSCLRPNLAPGPFIWRSLAQPLEPIAFPSPFPISSRILLPVSATGVMNVSVTVSRAKEGTYMKTFTIDAENNISAFATPEEAVATTATPFDTFASQKELLSLIGQWPAERLVAIWNSLAGVTPVKSFKTTKVAAGRIWEQIQSLGEAPKPKVEPEAKGGARAAKGAPAKAKATKKTTASKNAPKAKKAAKAEESAGPREGSKTAQVVAMLQRKNGVTLAEIMEKMGWQKHTVRGFMAGAMKKAGYTVESFKSDKGERTYRINQ